MRFEKVTIDEAIEVTMQARGWAYKDDLQVCLDNLSLPTRATAKSAGYDFYSPYDILVKKGNSVRVPLWIKIANMRPNVVLLAKMGCNCSDKIQIIDEGIDECIWVSIDSNEEDILIRQGEFICKILIFPAFQSSK